MNVHKRLSVVIPTFKTPSRLKERCLKSLSGIDCELIEVGGLPISEARNEGLQKARGDWVWFVDADDEVVPLAEIESGSGQWDADILLMGVRTRWGGYGKKWEAIPPELNGEMSVTDLKVLNDNLLFRYTCNKIYSREFLMMNGIRFESGTEPCEDAIFNLKCVLSGARWRSVRQVGYVYWKRLGSSLFRFCPTVERSCRRENELWEKLGACGRCGGDVEKVLGFGWSEEQIAAKVWDNRWLRGSTENHPPIRWQIRQLVLLTRRLFRFAGV